MRYRVYANIEGWKIVDVKLTLDDAMKVLDDVVSTGIEEFILVESSREKGDIVIISTMRSYLNKKEELKKQKIKRLGK